MNIKNIKVVGIGGIGGCLLPVLAKFLSHQNESNITITLIDGDGYEAKNRERQFFQMLGNKAEVTLARFAVEYPEINWVAKNVYITERNIVELIRKDDITLLCVDNHATRKLVSDRLEEISTGILISGGNEFTDGNIQVFIRKNGKNLTLPLTSDFHPEITSPSDRNPGEIGCEAMVESAPQLIITNNMIAALMINALYAFLQGGVKYDEVYVDIISNNARAVNR